MNHETITRWISQEGVGEDVTRQFLDENLDQYLGIVEPLGEFAKKRLADSWLLRFGEIVKSEKGTPAWRTCQQLWQTCLMAGITQVQQATIETQVGVDQIKREIVQISGWLDQWNKQLSTLPIIKRDPTGEEALEKILHVHLEAFNNKLDAVKEDTDLIIRLLSKRFTELDAEQVMVNFLQKELLTDQYVNLEQAGHHTEDEDISLAKVFVDLPMSNKYHADPPDDNHEEKFLKEPLSGIVIEVLNAANRHLDPESLSIEINEGDDKTSVLTKRKPGRFVIIGGPGQGKTTVGQFICQLFRAAILNNKPSHLLFDKVSRALGELTLLCNQDKIEPPPIPRFPVRIVLNDFAAKLASEKSSHINSLLGYIVDRIHVKTDQQITTDHLRLWLAEYPWIIFLDGLDEVPSSSNRDDVLSAVDNFLIDIASNNADVLVVATTRPQGYNKEFSPDIYQHKWLSPLSKGQALYYAERLVNVRYRQDQDRQQKIIDRLQSAMNDDATARLMRSPLQITIMTALVERIGKPPQERWSLFQRYYNVIFSRETERDIPAATILRNYEPDINAIHYRVGLLLQLESEYAGQTGVRLSRDRFAMLVDQRLKEEGHEGKERIELKKNIIEAAKNRLVFLVEVENGEIGFEIRSLQEFMAAEALMEGGDSLVRKRLWEIAPIVNWRNVFLFAAGKCFAERQHLRDTIQVICSNLNESEGSLEDRATQITLAGSQLALDLLEDGPARRQPKYTKSLARLAFRLLDLPPNDYQTRLAELYDPIFEDVYREEFENRLQNRLNFRLGAWNSLIVLVDKKVSWAEELVDTYWPDNEREQHGLFEVAVDNDKLLWITSRLLNQLPNMSPSALGRFHQFSKDDLGDIKVPWLNALLFDKQVIWVPLQLPKFEKFDKAFQINMISEGRSDWLLPLKGIPNPSPEWLPLTAAANFVESPSRVSLAQELKNISQNFSHESIKWIVDQVPWPLGALLESVASQQELQVISNRVRNGDFGDIEDWHKAEKRWLTQGVIVEDINYMVDEHWPFDKNIAHLGFPLNYTKFSQTIAQNVLLNRVETLEHLNLISEAYLDLYSHYDKAHQVRLRSMFAEAVLFLFLVIENYKMLLPNISKKSIAVSKLVDFSQYRKLVQDTIYLDSIIFLDNLARTEWIDIGNEEYIDFIDYLGNERRCVVTFGLTTGFKNLTESLSDIFTQNSTRFGILNILSELVKEGGTSYIPSHLLKLETHNNPKHREAAIIVRLVQENLSQDETKILAKSTAQLTRDRPKAIDRILKTVDKHKMVGSVAESFLSELYQHLLSLDSQWKIKKQVIKALDDTLRRRTSKLKSVWADLDLPEGLDDLIHTKKSTT